MRSVRCCQCDCSVDLQRSKTENNETDSLKFKRNSAHQDAERHGLFVIPSPSEQETSE
jgi:hypothetical protein